MLVRDTRFKPGQSGNPKGRPAGSRNKATLAAEALIDKDARKLTKKAIELALKGGTVALQLCLERPCLGRTTGQVCGQEKQPRAGGGNYSLRPRGQH